MVRFVSMTEEDYRRFVAWAIPDYAEQQIIAGAWQPEKGIELAERTFETLLPDGLSTPNQPRRPARRSS